MKTYRVSIPVMVTEENEDEPRLLRDADAKPGVDEAFMIGFRVRAESKRDAALIVRERLEPTCDDPG